MKQRRFVHRGAAVDRGEQHFAVLDHLLDENRFHRFIALANATRAQLVSSERQRARNNQG